MKRILLSFLFLLLMMKSYAQNNTLPYYEIPEAAETYTAGSVLSRMIDGLGFRYYWATEGLTEKDLQFQPNSEARTTEQTIDHIVNLSQVVVNAALKVASDQFDFSQLSFTDKRKKTLENLKKASDILKTSEDISQFKIIFKRGENTSEFPMWNAINGPIADALWHTGQIVSFRRSSGNPLPKGVNVFTGTYKNNK
ncbi:hypothetical protein [Tenacibaculum sp. IB213877]|uniref:hypothetical protein n=1 Tax=Tenacibaculum sp. IB213877 TaxID=3097351 RepID=UPI002A5A57E6|nr:hypothetical protein [Tenacibaculum sp. IB213877]MDY0779191.1 hypothetical protein [Tenacibaculum sp. IB213877]